MTTYDFIVIGGGRAGFSALAPVAASGERTALIDHGAIGGLCSLNGCNPKKVLVRSSEVVEELSNALRFGVDVSGMHAEWGRVIDRKETFTGGVTEQSEQMLRDMGTDLIHGAPRFIGSDRLVVGDEEYHASAFVIATGSIPRPLDFPGAEHVRSTDDILALRTVPEHLVCIGAGVVAFEFGQVFARLGSRVTILARDPALAGAEEEMVAALLDYSRELGIEVVSVESVAEVRDSGGGVCGCISRRRDVRRDRGKLRSERGRACCLARRAGSGCRGGSYGRAWSCGDALSAEREQRRGVRGR
ncbi:MAG: NAD(P)/FAD-dependent oxidoreductase [Bacteroidetes bacterium]|nr:NAD(P)/FAD-dependent oxidoreductase [Bacteroidota bacterium]